MTARVVLVGHICRPPEARVTKHGKAYVLAHVDDGDGRVWAAFAFRGSIAEALEHIAVGAYPGSSARGFTTVTYPFGFGSRP
jgi:hypothetical protein